MDAADLVFTGGPVHTVRPRAQPRHRRRRHAATDRRRRPRRGRAS